MTTFSTVESLLQIALENKQAMDEALRSADGAHRAKRQFAAVPAAPSAFGSLADLTERSGQAVQRPYGECARCEGDGALPASEFGDCNGQTYDSPGMVVCPDCYGSGVLHETALRYPHGSLGEECEFPERDACDIDDERDQGPLFDAPSERSMGRSG